MSVRRFLMFSLGFYGTDLSSDQQHWFVYLARITFYSLFSYRLYRNNFLIKGIDYSVSKQFFNVFNITMKASIIIFLMVTAIRARHRQSQFFNLIGKLQQIESVLKISHNKTSKFNRYLLICLIIFSCVMFKVVQFQGNDGYEMTLRNYLYLVKEIIVLMFLWSFSEVINVLNNIFQLLNERLLRIKSKNYSYRSIFSTLENDETPPLSFGAIGELHWLLCDLANSYNECYNEQLFPLTFAFLVGLIKNIGLACFDILDYTENRTLDKPFLNAMMWNFSRILTYSFLWLYITFPAANLSMESRRTLDIAKKLHSEYLPIETRKKLETLTLQLIHNKVEFNVFGVYSLNKSLLQSISGTSFTFAVFVMQFRNQN